MPPSGSDFTCTTTRPLDVGLRPRPSRRRPFCVDARSAIREEEEEAAEADLELPFLPMLRSRADSPSPPLAMYSGVCPSEERVCARRGSEKWEMLGGLGKLCTLPASPTKADGSERT